MQGFKSKRTNSSELHSDRCSKVAIRIKPLRHNYIQLSLPRLKKKSRNHEKQDKHSAKWVFGQVIADGGGTANGKILF
jgi:hypothetical protein